jgi:hypothetical protein
MFKNTRASRWLGPVLIALIGLWGKPAKAADPGIVYEGKEGPGKGKHIVLIAGDDEYRSEEVIPQLAKILAVRQGFKCTVLFAVNKETGEIDPSTLDNIPGLEVLKDADLLVMFLRWRELPDDQMKMIMDYTNSGKPILALRTSTHPFNYKTRKDSPYAKWSYNSKDPKGGYGRQVFGETWVNHYGRHNVESTRGVIADAMKGKAIVKGCEDIWGPSDVYSLTTLEGDCRPVIMGQVLVGMNPTDKPNPDKPSVPVAWFKGYTGDQGRTSRIFTTTMGHVGDLKSEGFRRLLVNACYWCLSMEDKIPERANVDLVGAYTPSDIGVGKFKKGMKPADLKM